MGMIKIRGRMCVRLYKWTGSLEVVVYSAFNPVGLQAEVNITTPSMMYVVLVKHIIQALVQVL